MNQRVNFSELSPKLQSKLFELSQLLHQGGLDHNLLDLINIRVSQINGCAFCLDMHVKEAKIHGERELRLYHVSIWHESPLFSEKEKAAFLWAETVTKLTGKEIPDEIYEKVRAQLSEKEMSDLTFAIGTINFWNRLNVSFPHTPGSMDEMMGLTKAGLR